MTQFTNCTLHIARPMTKVNSFSTSEDNRGAPVKSMGENKRVRSTLLVHTAGHAVGQNPKNDGARKGDFVMRGGRG